MMRPTSPDPFASPATSDPGGQYNRSKAIHVAVIGIAIIEHLIALYLCFSWVILWGARGTAFGMFLFPFGSLFLAGLLNVWLRYTLRDDQEALYRTAAAAAVWPWTEILFLMVGDRTGLLGLVAPYAITAVLVLTKWP